MPRLPESSTTFSSSKPRKTARISGAAQWAWQIANLPTKRCCTCGCPMLLYMFGSLKRSPDGLRNQCKECNNQLASECRQRKRSRLDSGAPAELSQDHDSPVDRPQIAIIED